VYTEKNAEKHTGNTEVVNKKATTCTDKGYTGDTVCADCKTVLESGTETSATGHTGGTATCVSGAKCENCGTVYTEKNAASHTGKTEVINAKAATCTEQGYTGDKICSDCKTLLETGKETSATGHTGGTATCTTQATCTTCGELYGELAAHTGGTATCAKKAVCTTCSKEYGELDLTTHTGGTATCTTQAICTTCGKEYGELLPHSYTVEVTKEASDTEEGICTYTCENCGYSYTESIPKVEPPYIEGEDGMQGWDAIRQKTGDAIAEALANPGEKKVVTVVMNGTVTVPGYIFTQIKGQDVTIVFDMGDGIKWSVYGKSVVNDNINDINFKVYTDAKANAIPNDIMADVINNVTGERYTMNLTLAYDGEFGFTAVMSIGLDVKNAGYYANLFYYNKTTNKLDFVCADRIAADGTANLTFTHASDYTIVIDTESLDPNAAPAEDTSTEPTTPAEEPSTEPTTAAEEPSTEPTTAAEEPSTEPTTPAEEPSTEAPTTAAPTTTQEPTTAAPTTTETPTTTTVSTTETTAAPTVVTPSTAAPTTEAAAESPKTGDTANAPLAVLLMLISEISVAACVMRRRKKN
jgi:hypothetical protein